MSDTAEAILLAVFILATSVWVGGYIVIAVVARTATATLDPSGRVAFFRSLGRSYLWVGVPALIVALGTGAVLLRDHDWDALLVATVMVATVMVVCLAVAVVQGAADDPATPPRPGRTPGRALGGPGEPWWARRQHAAGRARGAQPRPGDTGLLPPHLTLPDLEGRHGVSHGVSRRCARTTPIGTLTRSTTSTHR